MNINKVVISLLVCIATAIPGLMEAQEMGMWRSFPAYGDIAEVEEAGENVFVLATNSLFSFNTRTSEVTEYSKAQSLSDASIAHIAWCDRAKRLVVVYKNQNIDLIDNRGEVVNIPDYHMKSMTVDKTVNSISILGTTAYLATGFGIVELDVAGEVVKNTYHLGFSIDWVHADDKFIYAESKKDGQYSAALSDNIIDPSAWKRAGAFTPNTKTMTAEQRSLAEKYRPWGPRHNTFGFMKIVNDRLYTVTGKNDAIGRDPMIQVFDGENWNVVDNRSMRNGSPSYRNICEIGIDPTDTTHWFAVAVPGIYEYRNYELVAHYWWKNSIVERPTEVKETNMNYSNVSSVCFTPDGTAIFFPALIGHPGVLRKEKEGELTRLEHAEFMGPQGFSWGEPKKAHLDSRGRIWIVNHNWQVTGLAWYKPDTDEVRTYVGITNQDGVKYEPWGINSWEEDLDGNIWIGTNLGPFYLQSDDIDDESPAFYQVKIPRADDPSIADYMLNGVAVSDIVVDGGNRKWFATAGNGLYLMSADCMTELQHYTAENSPLPTNTIESMVMDHATGTLYVGTEEGLCALKTDVSMPEESLNKSNIYAYPNPVHPDYSGPITVKGLTYGAEVKIVTSSGHLVAQGQSVGGTFTWDGTDMQQRRVASGVYMVLAATADGSQGVVTKIAIVK